jgi:hypothetical protein
VTPRPKRESTWKIWLLSLAAAGWVPRASEPPVKLKERGHGI